MLRGMTLDLRSTVMLSLLSGVWSTASACSDDGVPADETTVAGDSSGGVDASASASASATDPTTQTTSVTATDTSPSTTADPTDATTTGTGPGSDDTSTGAGSGDSGSSSDGSSGDTGSSSDGGSSDGSSSTGESGNEGAPVGDPCDADGDCSTGVCWDFSDYDNLCSGTACSGPCDSDDDCTQLILDAGGAYPDESFCGDDGRCWMLGTGFGSYVCQ